MKKILIAIPALLFLFFISPVNAQSKNPKGSSGEKARKNLEVCRQINKAIMTGDVSKLDNLLTEDAVDHGSMQGDLVGREAIKTELAKMHGAAPDMKMEVIKELADEEYVFQWLRFTGTTATADMGMPPGTKFDMTAIELVKFKDGKAVEHWEFIQPADMMKMMPQSKDMDHQSDSTMHKSDSTMHKSDSTMPK